MPLTTTLTLFMALAAPARAGVDETPTAQALKLFQTRYKCDPSAATFKFVASEEATAAMGGKVFFTSWDVTGCGETGTYTWMSGKNGETWFDDLGLRKKASFELGCDAAQISYTYLDKYNRGATGCGGRISYVLLSIGNWAANTASNTSPKP